MFRREHFRFDAIAPPGATDLGRRTDMDRSDVAETLDELAGRGFIERSPDPTDGRRNIITITPAGTRQLHRLDEVLAGVQDELLAPLSDRERRTLIRMLRRVLEHHGQ